MAEAAPRKRAGRPKVAAGAAAGGSVGSPTDGVVTEASAPWFGRKQKMYGRSQVLVNDSTEEIDILSLAVHSGISTDEDLTLFLLNPAILSSLAAAAKTALSHSTKLTANPDGTLITRYYVGDPPEDPHPEVNYTPAPEDKPCRWAVRGYLLTTLCSLLDQSQRDKVRPPSKDGGSSQAAEEVRIVGSCMLTFRTQRRDLSSITTGEIDAAEVAVNTSQSITLARELIVILRMMLTNAEKAIERMSKKLHESEQHVEAEQALRTASENRRNSEASARILEATAVRGERQELIKKTRALIELRDAETVERMALLYDYHEGMTGLMCRFDRIRSECRRPPPIIMVAPPGAESADTEVSVLRAHLEDARLEVKRLKNDARGKFVPKPKTKRKLSKDPDLHFATEVEIRNAVRYHLGMSVSRGTLTTPMSSTGSTFAMRASRKVGASQASVLEEEKEIEAARKLKSLSGSREKDLNEAELASDHLSEVVESLSYLLTQVELTVEDVVGRRTAILNHMRSLSMHSRSIASIIRERPYLLNLARRMNHERRPVVQLSPLRALINTAERSLKTLQQVENITLESVGGVFEAMSLQEAAASAAQEEEEIAIPPTPVVHSSPVKVLTRATLRRHDVETGQRSSDTD